MAPPPIRKPTRAQNRTAGNATAAQKLQPDRNKFINVSEVLQSAIRAHNGASENIDRPDRCYIEFPYEAGSRERNRKALKVVEQHLERVLSFEENGQEKSYYGTYTFSELSPKLREAAVHAVTNDPDMKVFTQGENNWMVKTLIDQKMASKLRTNRGKARRLERDLKNVPSRDSQDLQDNLEELQTKKVNEVVPEASNKPGAILQKKSMLQNDDDYWVSDRLLEEHKRTEEAARRAQEAYEAVTNEPKDIYPCDDHEQLENPVDHDERYVIDESRFIISNGGSAFYKSLRPNATSSQAPQMQNVLGKEMQGITPEIRSVFDLPRVSNRATSPVLRANDSEENLSSIDEQIAALMKKRQQAVANMPSATKNIKISTASVPTARSRLQVTNGKPSSSNRIGLESNTQSQEVAQQVAQKRTREVSCGRGRSVRGKRR